MQHPNNAQQTTHNISESQLLEVAQDYAMREMRMKGQVLPTCFFVTRTGGIALRSGGFGDAADKADFTTTSRLVATAYKATAAAVVAEVWTAAPGNGCPDSWQQASEAPDRLECVIISVEGRRSTAWRVLLIKRDPAGAFTGLEEDSFLHENIWIGDFFAKILPSWSNKTVRAQAKHVLEAMGITCERWTEAAQKWN